MNKESFKHVQFVKTAFLPEQYPTLRNRKGDILPEVAVVGRSNVGKSSLLNHLFQSKGLAKVSSTPGKTQGINFFNVNEELAFVDLPGYGYAKVPANMRKQWGHVIQIYLEKREPLKLILFLFDIRREPSEEDLQFIEWANYYNKKVVLVLTKADKLKQRARKTKVEEILNCFSVALPFLLYSTVQNLGRKELIAVITRMITG